MDVRNVPSDWQTLDYAGYRPFKFGKEIPTNEEAARTSKGPQDDPVSDMNYSQRQNLSDILDRASADCTHTADDTNGHFENSDYETGDDFIYSILANDELYTTDIIFTREERQNIAGAQGDYHYRETEISNHSGDCVQRDEAVDLYGEDREWDHAIEANEHNYHIQLGTQVDYHNFDHYFQDQEVYDDHGHGFGFNRNINYREREALEESANAMQPPAKRIKLCESFDDVWLPATENDKILKQDPHVSGTAVVNSSNTRNDYSFTTVGRYTPDAPDDLLTRCDDDDFQMLNFLDSQRDADGFYPLSFGSSQQTRTLLDDPNSQQTDSHFIKETSSNDTMMDQNNILLPETNHLSVQAPLLDLPLSSAPKAGLDSRKHDFADFLRLRGKALTVRDAGTEDVPRIAPVLDKTPSILPVIPEAVLDRNTLRPLGPPSSLRNWHYYLASLNLIQKRVLVQSLSGQECAVGLIERDALGGVDLVLDHETAIIFISLMTVPSECDSLSSRISTLSWRFKHLLVIFECFPAARSYAKDHEARHMPFFAFSHPVVKAIRKLRRGLGIAEGSGMKRVECQVMWAFAEDVGAAARFSREFGDAAEGRDQTGGAAWGSRDWLMQNDGEDFEVRSCVASCHYDGPIVVVGRRRVSFCRELEYFRRMRHIVASYA
jgi:hypothetical protein